MEKEIHCRLYLWTVSKSPMTHSDLFPRKKGGGGRGGERVKGMGKGKKREWMKKERQCVLTYCTVYM